MSLTINLAKKEYLLNLNITHNLGAMWQEAGIYDALYNSAGMQASEVLPVLVNGLSDMIANPEKYKKLNSPNGWGLYENAVPWLAELIKGFNENPDAIIEVSK